MYHQDFLIAGYYVFIQIECIGQKFSNASVNPFCLSFLPDPLLQF